MKRKRVLHVVGNLDLGGGQKLTALIAAGLDRERFDVAVLNLGQPGLYGSYLIARGVKVIDLGLPARPRWRDLRATMSGLAGLMSILYEKPRWDIVHTHMFRTSLLCAVPARLAGSRLFGTVHRIYYRWQPPLERALAPLQEAIVVDSIAVGRMLQAATHIPQDRYAVIYNGIDVAEFHAPPSRSEARAAIALPEDVVVIAEIAHLAPHKGQDHLLGAFARISDRTPRLLLVGDGPTRRALEQAASELGVAARVTFTGERGDLALLLAASDILALPSTFEGFGIIQAEAMYMGLPVVATDRGGSTEVVVDGVTGFLVPFGDEDALAERLEQLIASPALRLRFGEAGRARVVERFTQQAMAARYADLYEQRLRRGLVAQLDRA
jgi:glycosyltransferase involved in cell wall biosynthesis